MEINFVYTDKRPFIDRDLPMETISIASRKKDSPIISVRSKIVKILLNQGKKYVWQSISARDFNPQLPIPCV